MPQVKHLVLLRIKPQTPREEVGEVFAALEDLTEKIPGLLDFHGGPYDSPEGLHQGFTHGFVMTFEDEESRDAYLSHSEHEGVKQQIIPLLDGGLAAAIAFDFKVCDRFRY